MDIIRKIKCGEVDELGLLEYVTSNDINIAIAAAESSIATEPILDIAARDRDRLVRLAAVKNLNIGKKTLQFLLKDSDEEVAKLAKERLEGDNS